MKITFQNSNDQLHDTLHTNQQAVRQNQQSAVKNTYHPGFRSDLGANGQDRMFAGARKGSALTMEQISQMAEGIDAGVLQNYMTIMSNTMSEEDFAKLEKDGFSFRRLKPEEAVTIVDKIKAEMAKAGVTVAGYNDDMDLSKLESALGSSSLAREVAGNLEKADLPLTDENLTEIQKAWELASSLTKPEEGVYQFLLGEGLEPDIWNFYVAQSSGAGAGSRSGAMFYAEDIQGYYTQTAGGTVKDGTSEEAELQEQIDRVIRSAGLDVNETNRQDASWILEHRLPLTPEKLKQYQKLKTAEIPVTEERFARAAANAIVEGKSPTYARLTKQGEENLYEEANRWMDQFANPGEMSENGAALADRRLLEEIRLRMTTEVNLKLLRSGFSIDTSSMEELVEALKKAEQQVAEQYFPGETDAVSKYELYTETNAVVKELPGMPARILGNFAITELSYQSTVGALVGAAGEELGGQDASENGVSGNTENQSNKMTTLSEIYSEGKRLQTQLDAAKESYETLMTAPRADLGDNIRKAFANVDSILQDLGLDLTEENRKAVRVLGYNRMDLSEENIRRVREAQQRVGSVIAKMTPAAVLSMIRDGINPLEKNFEELNQYLEEKEQDFDRSAESYSRFLHRLEKTDEITPEERESYIGIYRLLHQIQKKDGAAVGSVLNTGGELNFDTLLGAVRSSRFGTMDLRIADLEKGMKLAARSENAIDDQIAAAYRKQELDEVRRAADTGNAARELLERGELPMNADDLLAAEGLTAEEMVPFGKAAGRLTQKKAEAASSQELLQAAKNSPAAKMLNTWEKLDQPEGFREDYANETEKLRESVEEETFLADHSVDVKGLRLLAKQLHIAEKLAEKEEYYLPLEMDGKLAKLHLTVEKGQAEKGRITIETELDGRKTQASFQVFGNKVTGYLQGNGQQEVMKLEAAADIFNRYLMEETTYRMDAKPAVADTAKTVENRPTAARGQNVAEKLFGTAERGQKAEETPETSDLYRVAKLWIRAVSQKEVGYEN